MWPLTFIRSRPEEDWRGALLGWPPPVLDPAGPFAAHVTVLAWALFAMAVVTTLVVLGALGAALFGGADLKRALGGERMVWIGGVAFPVVVLTALLVWGLQLTSSLERPPPADALRIRVTGEMWWWRVVYLDANGREIVEDANEVHVPVGRPIVFELTSNDVIHSFWVPRLAGKRDMIPGRVNTLSFVVDEPGTYGGQCAEYCGGPHALMGFLLMAHEPEVFERTLAARASAATPPASAAQIAGARVFAASGCGACHAVRGTSANGRAGPDLTHVGARGSLGAGILPNNRGTLGGWIANAHDIKPGVRMPPYTVLSGPELLAVSAYLEGLK